MLKGCRYCTNWNATPKYYCSVDKNIKTGIPPKKYHRNIEQNIKTGIPPTKYYRSIEKNIRISPNNRGISKKNKRF